MHSIDKKIVLGRKVGLYISLLILAITITCLTSITLQAAEIMKLAEVEPGMRGVARTVFKGYKVEEFPVEVIDIIKDQGIDKNLILVKAGGEKIEEIGGIAAGMSGSPVYINNKLIGAIGYGWDLSDHRYCLVTPIEDMLALFDSKKNNDVPGSLIGGEKQLKTPLYVSGMSGRSFERLKKDFEEYGFRVVQSWNITGRQQEKNPFPLSPGSAIAVQLVRGDINIASIGTLTYIDEDDNLLAFGHPFFNKGKVDYLLSEAYINSVIPSLSFPFKLGSPTDELLGAIRVDRGAGVAGKLRNYPKIIPLRVRVTDKERGMEKGINVQLVRDEDLLSSLVTNVSLQAADTTLDKIGKGTARVKWKITGNGLPDLSIERENIFYSRHDIAAMALTEFYQLLDIITFNPFKKINLIDIQLNIEVEEKDNVALVQEARVLNEKVKPGDQLEIEVTIHPYRQETINQKYYFQLPEDIEPGMATLLIDGGFTWESYQNYSEEEVNLDQEMNQAISSGYKDLNSILDDFLKRPKNNELILQVYPSYPAAGMETPMEEAVNDGESTKDGDEQTEREPGEPQSTETEQKTHDQRQEPEQEIKEIYTTEYVLEGSLTLDINIEEPEKDEDEVKQNPPLPRNGKEL